MEPIQPFQYEIEKLEDDHHGNKVTTVKCHGKLTSQNSSEIKAAIKPLLAIGGRTVVDLGDVAFLDSSGLGALVSLKVSAINQGMCRLEFVNLTPRVLELLRITRLKDLLTS
jgi:anti-sigma B factor antagonist